MPVTRDIGYKDIYKTVTKMATVEAIPIQTKEDDPFPQELPGWDGYVEWEKYPERRAKANEILQKQQFADVSETEP